VDTAEYVHDQSAGSGILGCLVIGEHPVSEQDACACAGVGLDHVEHGLAERLDLLREADAIVRVVPGVIGDEQSALSDCFQDDMLSAPIYTRPADYKGWKVPDILLSGNEAKIRNWELEQAMERTKRLRPDLLKE